MLSEKTVDFIMALWEEAGEAWKMPDGMAAPKPVIRQAILNSSPEWADTKISYLKGKKSAQKVKRDAGSPSASPKQISYGVALDVKANGCATHDWKSASMADAWKWINELKDASSVGSR